MVTGIKEFQAPSHSIVVSPRDFFVIPSRRLLFLLLVLLLFLLQIPRLEERIQIFLSFFESGGFLGRDRSLPSCESIMELQVL